MAMLMTPMAIAGMAKMAIMAIMVTSVMANGNFSMALWGMQLKGTKKVARGVKFIAIGPSVQTLSTFL